MTEVYRVVGGEPGYETACNHIGMLVTASSWLMHHKLERLTETEVIILKLAGEYIVDTGK